MKYPTSFTDELLIEAAIDYSYRMSRNDIHSNPIEAVSERIKRDFDGRYDLELVENLPIKRLDQETNKNEVIQLRYLLIKDTYANPFEYALVFQGSSSVGGSFLSGEGDWSNNFSNAVHLEVQSYRDAQREYQYLAHDRAYNITAASGNSLGGGLALSLGDLTDGLRLIGVNPSPPQYDKAFKNHQFSTIINTSTDALTRVLPVDIMRYKKEDSDKLIAIMNDESMSREDRLVEYDKYMETIDKSTKFFYGVDNYRVKRSLFYSEEVFFEGSHRTMILEPRKVAIEAFKNNLRYYTTHQAKAMLDITKELLSRHDKLSKSITSLIQEGDTKFLVDHYIEPILHPLHQQKYDDFKKFPSLANYLTFDIQSDNLINDDGSLYRDDNNFVILDHDDFIAKLWQDKTQLVENYSFPISRLKHDLEEERVLNTTDTDLKKDKNFFVDSFNLAINLEVDMYDLVKNVPVPIISKLYLARDQSLKFIKGLNSQLNNLFFDKEELTEVLDIDVYRDYYQDQVIEIERVLKVLSKQYEVLISNVEIALSKEILNIPIINKLQSHRVLEQFNDYDTFEIKQAVYEGVDPTLIHKHRERVSEIVLDFRMDKIDDLLESSKTMIDTVTTTTSYINKELEDLEVSDRNSLKTVSKQLNAMMDNIEIPSLFFNFLDIYKEDLVTLVLKDTAAQSIDMYYHQIMDMNIQGIRRVNNLKQYIIANTKSDVQKDLCMQCDEIIVNINELSSFLKKNI